MYIEPPHGNIAVDYRIKILGRIMLVVLLILAVRLFYLQVFQGSDYRTRAESNRIRIIRTRTPRGIIYDRQNFPLATNRRVFSIFFDAYGESEKDKKDSYDRLVRILLDRSPEYADELTKKADKYQKYRPRKVAEDVDFDVVAAVREQSVDLPGVYVRDEFIRYYPLGSGTAHLMGYLRAISIDELQLPKYQDYELSDVIGRNGIEQVYEQDLRGLAGGWMIEVDARGRKRRDVGQLPSVPGNNLVMNIDAHLQKKAYDLLQGKRGTIVAMDPNNGAVLAMVSEPSYDSNMLSGYMTANQWARIANDPGHPMQNRAIMGTYPPGSVFKLLTAIAGLEQKKITPNTTFSCPGYFRMGKWVFKCSHTHGTLNLNRGIAMSCNVYFYHTAQLVGIDSLLALAERFNIGKDTGVDLLNERSGFLPTRAWKKKFRKEGWYPGDTVQLGIGQGFLLVTPLQICNMVSTIANGGTVYRPFIVKQVEDGSGRILRRYNPVVLNQIGATPETMDIVHKGMWSVVNAGGTATLAHLPDVAVAGKTGTAQSGTGGKDHAWFCGYAPYEKPEITVMAMVEEGGFGGVAAAPLAREMFRTYFNMKKGIVEPLVPSPRPRRESTLVTDSTQQEGAMSLDTSTTMTEKAAENGTGNQNSGVNENVLE
jgi:penicillin-binding protein 2